MHHIAHAFCVCIRICRSERIRLRHDLPAACGRTAYARDKTKEARRQFADWVGADLYLEIGLSSDPEDASVYGISGEYNDEYYIPEFGNLQWADCVTRQVTVAASNRAVGLFPATEEDVLWEIAIPSARISLGYVTNAAERQLLIQEDYQKKLAQGIAEAINEVYTNTQ